MDAITRNAALATPAAADPERPEIDNRTLKLVVGVIAIGLPILTDVLTHGAIESISESYYHSGPASVVFVGFLFAIAAFLCAYNGRSRVQMILSKVAGIAAAFIALFPCNCGAHPGSHVHYVAATTMFAILTYFCWAFYERSLLSPYAQAKARRAIYLACAIAMVLAVLMLVGNGLHLVDHSAFPKIVYCGEATGLLAFGLSWLTASRTVPVLTHPSERFSPLRAVNPLD